MPSRTALELSVTGASERIDTLALPSKAFLEPWHDSAGFRATAADVDLKASMLLSEEAWIPAWLPKAFPPWVPWVQGQGARMRSQSPRCAIRRWLCGASQHWPQPGLALENRDTDEKRTEGYSYSQLLWGVGSFMTGS